MKASYRQKGSELFVKIIGNTLDENTNFDSDKLSKALELKNASIVLDLEHVIAMTSLGIKEIMMFHKRIIDKGGTLRIINANRQVSEILRLAKLIG